MSETAGGQGGGGAIPENGPVRSTAQSFSDIVTILMRTEPFRSRPLAELEWLVVPPLVRRQFALAHATENPKGEGNADAAKGPPMPVGLVMWASVSQEVDARFRNDTTSPLVTMEPDDWVSGEIPWIIVAAGLPNVLKSMMPQVAGKVFPGRGVNMRLGDGKTFKTQLISQSATN